RGWLQVDFARKVGVNKATMNAYEMGRRWVDEATLERISQALRCKPIDLWKDAFKLFLYNYFRREPRGTHQALLTLSPQGATKPGSLRRSLSKVTMWVLPIPRPCSRIR